MIRFGLIVFGFFLTTNILFAQSSEFIITTTITTPDVVAPTVPTNLTTIPASDTQITLNWTASTDNVAVAGYQIYRDNFQIATTGAVTTFSDTGLASTTLYSYFIRAFDSSGNTSASSTASATTTLETIIPPLIPETPDSSQSTRVDIPDLEILTFETASTIDTAQITFTTNVFSSVLLEWDTAGVAEAIRSSSVLRRNHQYIYTDLEPDTTYYGVIYVTDRFGRNTRTQNFSITTAAGADEVAPANIRNFSATPDENQITLRWLQPEAIDFDRVRIVRSEEFYPVDIADGGVVYEGSGIEYKDTDVVPGVIYYYSAFAADESGNYSSGAVTFATLRIPVQDGEGASDEYGDDAEAGDQVIQELDSALEDVGVGVWRGVGVTVRQNDEVQYLGPTSTPIIMQLERTTISVPYTALPQHLKTIVVTFTDPVDTTKTFSFLLRANAGFTRYEATIAPLPAGGSYPVRVQLFDFKSATKSTIGGHIEVIAPTITVSEAHSLEKEFWSWLLVLFLLFYIYWQYRLVRRSFY